MVCKGPRLLGKVAPRGLDERDSKLYIVPVQQQALSGGGDAAQCSGAGGGARRGAGLYGQRGDALHAVGRVHHRGLGPPYIAHHIIRCN